MFVIPRTKQIASRILDFPLPFSPVMELKLSSLCDVNFCYATRGRKKKTRKKTKVKFYHELITVRTAYDLKPYKDGQKKNDVYSVVHEDEKSIRL